MEYLQIYEKNQKKVRIKNPLLYWKNGRAVYCLCLLYKRNKNVSVGSNPTFSIKNQKKVNMYTYPLEIGIAVTVQFVGLSVVPLPFYLFYLSAVFLPTIILDTEILLNEVVCPVVDTLGHQIYDFIYPPIIQPEIIPEVIDVVPAVIDDYEGRTEIDDQENPVSVP